MSIRTSFNVALVLMGVMMGPAALAAQQGPRLDGDWQVSVDMEVPGMPTGLPTHTMNRCITKAEAANPENALPQATTDGSVTCKVSNYKSVGNTITWALTCIGETPIKATGELVYSGSTYTGAMTLDVDGETMTMKYAATRVGDCIK